MMSLLPRTRTGMAMWLVALSIPLLGCRCNPRFCRPTCEPACRSTEVCERSQPPRCVDRAEVHPECQVVAGATTAADTRRVRIYLGSGYERDCFEMPAGTQVQLPASWSGKVGSARVDRGMRAYLCPQSWKQGRCKLLRGSYASATSPVRRVFVESALWGVADLHTHPAVHFGFGADATGGGGIFWGRPANEASGLGLTAATGSIAQDLAPCTSDKHMGYTDDVVRHRSQLGVIQTLDKVSHDLDPASWPWPTVSDPLFGTAETHAGAPMGAGWPGLTDWPHARSLTHQQMHLTWLRRAWEGGLRLLVASAVDNQVLHDIWHRSYGKGPPVLDPNFDFTSAQRQLTFIRNLVSANLSWMGIARTPKEARELIASNKLAVILGVEMDQLTADQILSLRSSFEVRLATPIHLVDNSFGGAAVYTDAFNAANHFLNGTHFQVVDDPALTFRLEPHPKFLRWVSNDVTSGGNIVSYGSLDPDARATNQVYPPCMAHPCPGHRNARGAQRNELERLMSAGMLIDVAHMSERSMTDAIEVAEQHAYPVLNSHSGLRSGTGDSERAMPVALARRMAALGGVLGLGTGFNRARSPVKALANAYVMASTTMSGRGVALGTDLNGFAAQLSTNESRIDYPLIAADEANFSASPSSRPRLGPLTVGGRTYDFAASGLAHVGLLPELFEALYDGLGGDPSRTAIRPLDPLFQSAHDVIDMWEMAERAALLMSN